MKTFLSKNLFLATIVFAIYSCSSFNHEYNDYIETSTEMAIDGKYDSIDIHALKIMNNVYTSNNDSANICTLNLIFGIINYNTLRLDSALFHLLKAEQFSNCKPELKPHIYYYLASAFIDYDPILAHDIIYSHQECSIDKYDYSRFLNINVTDIEKNTHNFNSIYYSTLIQRSLVIVK